MRTIVIILATAAIFAALTWTPARLLWDGNYGKEFVVESVYSNGTFGRSFSRPPTRVVYVLRTVDDQLCREPVIVEQTSRWGIRNRAPQGCAVFLYGNDITPSPRGRVDTL